MNNLQHHQRKTPSRRALLYELDPGLRTALVQALAACAWGAETVKEDADPKGRIVFCSHERDVVKSALERFAPIPVVVVSRLPEVDGWLDALEAGAADYCAAPFESVQVRWLLETHTSAAAAAA